MGRPSKGVKAEVMCLELSAVQRSALEWLARWVKLQSPSGASVSIMLPRGRGLHQLGRQSALLWAPAPLADPTGVVRAAAEHWSDLKLADTCAAYDEASFVTKHSKSRLRKTHVTVWGGEIQSESGWVASSREKMDLAGTADINIGHWVHQLTFQRLGMCLLDDVYQVLHRRRLNKKLVVLTKGAQDELLALISLWPLFSCDLRRPPAPIVTAFDATTRMGGAVVRSLTSEEATWMWSRLPRRPGAVTWRSAENVLEVLQNAPTDEALEIFVNSHELEVILNYRFALDQHIIVQEMVAARSLLKWVTRRPELHSCRLPVFVDNLVVQSVLARSRLCSRSLNRCGRGLSMLCLFANIQILSGWLRFDANPAYDPTRLNNCSSADPFDET
eukprot:5172620-Amphidinium_carterae.3